MKATAADRRAYQALPALRSSLCLYKRETIKALRRHVTEHLYTAPRLSHAYADKCERLRAAPPVAFRASYMSELICEIRRAPLYYLAQNLSTHPSTPLLNSRMFVRLEIES
jgi:hypothetical protein